MTGNRKTHATLIKLLICTLFFVFLSINTLNIVDNAVWLMITIILMLITLPFCFYYHKKLYYIINNKKNINSYVVLSKPKIKRGLTVGGGVSLLYNEFNFDYCHDKKRMPKHPIKGTHYFTILVGLFGYGVEWVWYFEN